MGKHLSHATQECFVMQREEMELLAVRATLWRMEIELLREIHRYRFAKRGRRFGSDVELMIVYGAAMLYYGFRTPVRALPISRYLEIETIAMYFSQLLLARRPPKPASISHLRRDSPAMSLISCSMSRR
jgi:hypothetical protein